MCEIEPYARGVLSRHWPGVPIFDDVRTLKAADLPAKIDVITGGFPCQDISLAGKGAGITGARSGLWVEMFRVISEVRPAWVVVENVSALRSRGLDSVLGALASIGYDAEWHCIPASAVGAPHRRDRVWIIAHGNPDSHRQPIMRQHVEAPGLPQLADMAYPARVLEGRQVERAIGERVGAGGQSVVVADADNLGAHGAGAQGAGRAESPHGRSAINTLADGDSAGLGIWQQGDAGQQPAAVGGGWWEFEPDVGRVAHGIPRRVDRLKGLGNAVVPQIPEMIARAIRDLCAT